jgi:hypothetical protein
MLTRQSFQWILIIPMDWSYILPSESTNLSLNKEVKQGWSRLICGWVVAAETALFDHLISGVFVIHNGE